ncbi:MAG: hypothetical protein MZV63_67500 [Marinilabiliales bacterium]|nr:hypothetical protein [Marinilabiliales bacterium]
MKFFDPLNGIAIIHKTDLPNSRDEYVATTSDGGSNWNLLDLEIKRYSYSLYFVDNIAFVAAENNQIFKSKDWGQSWQTISTPIESYNDVRNIYFYNENIGYIDGISQIYKTIDGGLNWEETNFPFTYFGTFHFSSEDEGFNIQPIAVYDGGDFPTFKGSISYETLDGGITWTKSELMKSLYLGMTFFPKKRFGIWIKFFRVQYYQEERIDQNAMKNILSKSLLITLFAALLTSCEKPSVIDDADLLNRLMTNSVDTLVYNSSKHVIEAELYRNFFPGSSIPTKRPLDCPGESC